MMKAKHVKDPLSNQDLFKNLLSQQKNWSASHTSQQAPLWIARSINKELSEEKAKNQMLEHEIDMLEKKLAEEKLRQEDRGFLSEEVEDLKNKFLEEKKTHDFARLQKEHFSLELETKKQELIRLHDRVTRLEEEGFHSRALLADEAIKRSGLQDSYLTLKETFCVLEQELIQARQQLARLEFVTTQNSELENKCLCLKKENEELTQKLSVINSQLEESKRHAEHFEKGIQYLREKLEEKTLDHDETKEELARAQETITQKDDQLHRRDAEKNSSSDLLLDERKKREQIEEELCALLQQLQNLRTLFTEANAEKEQGKIKAEELHLQLAKTCEENEKSRETYAELRQSLDQLIEREAQQRAKLLATQQEAESAEREIEEGKKKIERKDEEITALKKILAEKELSESQVSDKLALSLREKEEIRQKLIHLQNLVDEKDQQVRMAQQHLAKKVKDTSLALEKNEEQKGHIDDLKAKLTIQMQKVEEAEAKLREKRTSEMHEMHLLQEKVRTSEKQIGLWEEKYFKIYEELRDKELHLKELEKREEKYIELEGVLASLGHVMENSKLAEKTVLKQKPQPKKPKSDPVEEKKPPLLKTQDLFEPQKKPPSHYQQNFFD